MKLIAHGLEADLLPGWEGRISLRRPKVTASALAAPSGTTVQGNDEEQAPAQPPEQTHPVMHLANFPLPEQRGDFGSGAVNLMSSANLLIVLFEYGRESVGQPLFKRRGMPDRLRPDMFSGSALQQTIPGQAGTQVFFTEADRAFCLYVVLGQQRAATSLVPLANRTLSATKISPR